MEDRGNKPQPVSEVSKKLEGICDQKRRRSITSPAQNKSENRDNSGELGPKDWLIHIVHSDQSGIQGFQKHRPEEAEVRAETRKQLYAGTTSCLSVVTHSCDEKR